MRMRPARPLIFMPITRFGVIDTHWKYIAAATMAVYLVSLFARLRLFGFPFIFIGPPAVMAAGITFSIFLRRNRPPRWLEHQTLYLVRRLHARWCRRPPGFRRQLPGLDLVVAAQRRAPARARAPEVTPGPDFSESFTPTDEWMRDSDGTGAAAPQLTSAQWEGTRQ
jgi:hypothetical protein